MYISFSFPSILNILRKVTISINFIPDLFYLHPKKKVSASVSEKNIYVSVSVSVSEKNIGAVSVSVSEKNIPRVSVSVSEKI